MPEDEAGLAAWAQSLREFGDDRLTREIMERVTLAQVFDAVEYGRGPLASYAKALRLGAFAPDPPRPRLNLPASDIEAICADLRALPEVVSAWDRDLALKAARGATHGAPSRAPAEPPREGARSRPGSRR